MGNLFSGYIGGPYVQRENSDWDLTRQNTGRESSHGGAKSSGGGDAPPPQNSPVMDPDTSQKQCKRIGDNVQGIDPVKFQKLEANQPKSDCSTSSTTQPSKRAHAGGDGLESELTDSQQKSNEIYKFAASRQDSSASYTNELGPECPLLPCSIQNCDQDQSNQIDRLPGHVLVQIFQCLSLPDLLRRVCLVSKYWYHVARDPDLWRSLNLRGQTRLDDGVLQRLITYSETINSVDISDARAVSDDGIEALAKKCTSLQKVKLVRCLQLKEPAFLALGKFCPNVVSLYLNCCFSVTDTALQTIAVGCPRLRVLYINQCSQVTNEGIEAVGGSCPQLQELCIDQCKQVGDRGLLSIVQGCPKMTKLSAMSCVFTSQGILHLTKLLRLRHLELHDVLGVTDDCVIEVVRCCQEIELLNLALCTQVTDRCVKFVASHSPKLRSLYVASCDLTNQALISLGKHSSTVETVDVGWCSNVTDEGAIYISENSRSLRALTLIRCDKVTVPTMDALVEKFPHIHYSTFWLDCKRFLNQAQKLGYSAPLPFPAGGQPVP